MDLWNCERPVMDFDIDVPAWVEQDITCCDVASIEQGGCASGAYMPAVIHNQALETMRKHGDEVLQYIKDIFGELPTPPSDSWSGLACFYLSTAVEAWALGAHSELQDKEEDKSI